MQLGFAPTSPPVYLTRQGLGLAVGPLLPGEPVTDPVLDAREAAARHKEYGVMGLSRAEQRIQEGFVVVEGCGASPNHSCHFACIHSLIGRNTLVHGTSTYENFVS